MTSKLDFYRNPQWMKQFPFAHTLEMTYRLADGVLEVRTRDREPQHRADAGRHRLPPVLPADRFDSRGLDDLGRREDTLAARAENKIPTGETEPIRQVLSQSHAVALKDFDLDHVFGDLERDAQGRAVVSVKGKTQQLDVLLGPNYRVDRAVLAEPGQRARRRWRRRARPRRQPADPPAVPAPMPLTGATKTVPNRGFIAIEPMVGITDSMNLAHKGLYKELQSIPPGGRWQESFWLRPSGF